MPRPAKGSHRVIVDNNQVHETSEEESTSFNQEVFLNPQPSTSAQVMPNMYMPYIEGPQMDWTVNDGLYEQISQVATKMWEHIRLWACDVTRAKKV